MEDDTSSAVDTEFGRGHGARSTPLRESGDSRDDARNRMLRWKASVEKEQRITVVEEKGGREKQKISLVLLGPRIDIYNSVR